MSCMCFNKDEDETMKFKEVKVPVLICSFQTFEKTERCGDQRSLHVCTEQSTNVRLKEQFTLKKKKYPHVVPETQQDHFLFTATKVHMIYVIFLVKKKYKKGSDYRNNVLCKNIFK